MNIPFPRRNVIQCQLRVDTLSHSDEYNRHRVHPAHNVRTFKSGATERCKTKTCDPINRGSLENGDRILSAVTDKEERRREREREIVGGLSRGQQPVSNALFDNAAAFKSRGAGAPISWGDTFPDGRWSWRPPITDRQRQTRGE